MKLVIQRVKSARARVDSRIVGRIERGLVVLVGVGREDDSSQVKVLAKKVCELRIFEDDDGKMNLSLKDIGGGILSVPQFTLYADTRKGNRPGFSDAAKPDKAKADWLQFNESALSCGIKVEKGLFAAHMEVELINDGPVTIIM